MALVVSAALLLVMVYGLGATENILGSNLRLCCSLLHLA